MYGYHSLLTVKDGWKIDTERAFKETVTHQEKQNKEENFDCENVFLGSVKRVPERERESSEASKLVSWKKGQLRSKTEIKKNICMNRQSK